MEAIFYGLPMWRLSAEVAELPEPIAATVTTDTQYDLDVRNYELSLDDQLMQIISVPDRGSYYALAGQTQAALVRPIQPKGSIELAAVSGQVAHGALFLSGSYTDYLDFDPILTMPVWTRSVPELNFMFEGWDPARFWSLAQLENADGSFDERLVIVPGQFDVDEEATEASESTIGTQRLYADLNFDVFYGPANAEFQPPVIGLVQASLVGDGTTLFKVTVEDPPDELGRTSDVVHVVVTYTEESGGSDWQNEELILNAGTGKWEGLIDTDVSIDFFVQAVDGAGNTGMFAGNGYFTPMAVQMQGPSDSSSGEVLEFTVTPHPEFEDPEILWDFGDGSVAEGSETVEHAYSQPGEYEVIVRVVDKEGNIGEATLPVGVEPTFTSFDSLFADIGSLPIEALRSGDEGYRQDLLDKTITTYDQISQGDIKGARQKLEKDLRAKMDGCPTSADANDWVTDCAWQYQLRTWIDDLIQSLEDILASQP
jgi:hypothetical protein